MNNMVFLCIFLNLAETNTSLKLNIWFHATRFLEVWLTAVHCRSGKCQYYQYIGPFGLGQVFTRVADKGSYNNLNC